MRTTGRRARIAAHVALMAAVLSGCTTSNLDTGRASAPSSEVAPTSSGSATAEPPGPRGLAERATTAMKAVSSGHMRGRVVDTGEQATIDTWGTMDGTNGESRSTIGSARAEFITASGRTYARGNADFWSRSGAPPDKAELLSQSNKWISAPASTSTASIDNPTFANLFNETFAKGVTVGAPDATVTSEIVQGVDSWVIHDRYAGDEIAIAVDKTTLLPVRITQGDDFEFSFDEWNSAPVATAPVATAPVLSDVQVVA